MQLSLNAIAVLKHVLTYDGKKEIVKDNQGKEQEVSSARKLNVLESVQRRFFFKNVEAPIKEASEEIEQAVKVHNTLRDSKKEELEKSGKKKDIDKALSEDKEIQASLKLLEDLNKQLNAKKIEFQLEPKTKEVVNKYFQEYANEVGFAAGDDPSVSELEDALK